jgi:putative peptide zinc metalloprotease protein
VELQDLPNLNQRLTVDTSEKQPVYLLVGKNGSYMRLSASAYQLLQCLGAGISVDELAERLSQQQGHRVLPSEVEAASRKLLERIAEIEGKANRLPRGFWLRIPCLPEAIVATIAQPLSVAFHPVAAFCLLGSFGMIMLMLQEHGGLSFNVDRSALWPAYVLFLLSLLVHEFGHASACARYRVRPSDIGFTIYLIYLAFYSNVSAAWQLKRRQRVIVDLGGVFFQLSIGAVFVAVYLVSEWEPLRVAFLMILASCVFMLNPVFKFDGYWVVADALGVTNLGRQPRRILGYLLDRLRGRPTKALPWPPSIIGILAVYTILSIGIWAYFIWVMLPMLSHVVADYPSLVATLASQLVNAPSSLSVERLTSLAFSTFLLFITLLMLRRLVSVLLVPGRALLLRVVRAVRGIRSSLRGGL